MNLSTSFPPRADCMSMFSQPGALISPTVLLSTGSGSGRGRASKNPCSVSAIGGGAAGCCASSRSSGVAKSLFSAGAVCPFPNLMKSITPSAIASAAHAALASSNVAYSTSTENARNKCSESLICKAHPYSLLFFKNEMLLEMREGAYCLLACCRLGISTEA